MVHDQVCGAVLFKIVETGHDIRFVPEPSKLLCLVPEAAQPILKRFLGLRIHRMHSGTVAGAHRQLAGQEFLDRVQPIGIKVVPRQIDDAETATAQLRLDDVVA